MLAGIEDVYSDPSYDYLSYNEALEISFNIRKTSLCKCVIIDAIIISHSTKVLILSIIQLLQKRLIYIPQIRATATNPVYCTATVVYCSVLGLVYIVYPYSKP